MENVLKLNKYPRGQEQKVKRASKGVKSVLNLGSEWFKRRNKWLKNKSK